MVCLACLLPLFLIPLVNALPLLFHLIMARVYRLLGWEYRKLERAPATCPYKPAAGKGIKVNLEVETAENRNVVKPEAAAVAGPQSKSLGADNDKSD